MDKVPKLFETRYVTTELRVHRTDKQPKLEELEKLLDEWGLFATSAETCWVVAYDAVTQIRTVNEIARGNYYEVQISIPSMLSAVLTAGTDRFYVIHSHPSGNVMPTKMDVELTRQIMAAANTIGLFFEDHIIIGPPDRIFSMANAGIIRPSSEMQDMITSARHDAVVTGAGQPVWRHKEPPKLP